MSKFLYHKIQHHLLNQKPYSDYKKSHQEKILFLGIQPIYLASNIEAPLHTLQDACIVVFITENKFNGFDCDNIGL